eukprot:scaffold36304_cov121-Isochrysis_galbana.AAC.5
MHAMCTCATHRARVREKVTARTGACRRQIEQQPSAPAHQNRVSIHTAHRVAARVLALAQPV